MTFTRQAKKTPRVLVIPKSTTDVQLTVAGQGVLFFEHADVAMVAALALKNAAGDRLLEVEVSATAVVVRRGAEMEPLIDPTNTSGLDATPGAYYWLSLDAQNARIQLGVGEARVETAIYRYQFEATSANKKWLEGITTIGILDNSTLPTRLLRDPITRRVPLKVRGVDDLTMSDIATGVFMPVANMTATSQKLYNCIAGRQFVLDDANFPDFATAIEYSITTPGLWCHETLKAKATTFGEKPNLAETYLRITLNENNGESPGIPYVMEIWPAGHYSPIHNHGGSSAVIRVLHGGIHVRLFSFLGGPQFAAADFKKDDVTWLNPVLNQVHQLENTAPAGACITIQCYMYEAEDSNHYDYFDYINADGKIEQFEPDSDMDFVRFKETVRSEWLARKAAKKPGFWQRVKAFFTRRHKRA